jgi:hypothetical protein
MKQYMAGTGIASVKPGQTRGNERGSLLYQQKKKSSSAECRAV